QEFTHQPEKIAGYFLTATLAAFGLGRFSSAWIMQFVAPNKLLGSYAVVNVFLIAFATLHPGWGGLYALFATSFFLSIMFPTIFALGLKGLGPNTKLGGSFLVMAIVGGAVFPLVLGWIARATGSLAWGYVVPLVGFAGVGLYGFLAPRVQPKEVAAA